MLGVNVAISNLNVCETNVVVRLQIKDNANTGCYKKRDDTEVEQTAAYNKYGFSNRQLFPKKSRHETPTTQDDTGITFGSYGAGCNNAYPENYSPARLKPLVHTNPPIQNDAMWVSKNTKEHNNYNSNLELQTALQDSESHRLALANKLQETRSVLDEQNNKLRKIESAAIDNSFLLENLRFKEMEFHKAIDHFEVSVKEKHLLQLRNLQLKEDIQERINALDLQLRNIKRQQLIRGRISKSFSDSTPFALSTLMDENTRLQQDKVSLLKMVQEMTEEMKQLRSLLQMVTDENKKLSVKWTSSAEDKVQVTQQVEEYENTVSDLKSRLSSVTAAHDRLLQEKVQVGQQLQQMTLEKEEITKVAMTVFFRAHEEYQKLHIEYSNLRHEYGLLSTKHQHFVNRYGDDGLEQKEKQEMTMMRTERDELTKKVTFLRDQLSQAENSKTQADDQLTRLTSELEEVKAELKLSSNNRRENAPGDFDAENSLKQKLEMLRQHMSEFQEYDLQQENMMKIRQENSPDGHREDTFHCKSLDPDSFSDSPGSTEPSKTQLKGHYGGCFFNPPDKSEADENNRLQNLISKYASEMEAADHQLAAKPLSRPHSPMLLSKSRLNHSTT